MGYRKNNKFQIKAFWDRMFLETGNGCKMQRPIEDISDSFISYFWYQCPAYGLPLPCFETFYKHMFGKSCTISPYHTDLGQTPDKSQPCST